MDRLISDLLDLPEQVHRGDFVLNLSEGVTPDHAEATLRDYVVTDQLAAAFDNALGFVRAAVEGRSSKAAYLHGSFGAGKSHFMAVLHLLLQHDLRARSHENMDRVCTRHDWVQGKRFLLVPYHMIGARNMESAILGGYADRVRRVHPDAPWPGIYLADDLFANAARQRELLGDERFLAEISQGAGGSKWGKIGQGWTAERFDAAVAAPPGDDLRGRLVGDLVKHLFPAYHGVSGGKTESFLPLDKGLSVISRHARELGYDALILFLDELILWLASHAANSGFVHQEGQKLAKLVESQTPDRPLPVVSFVARQRDLRDLVGKNTPGAEQLAFADAVKWWEGRFHTIVLEDRNLPVIAEKRVLRPRDEACRDELRRAFEQAIRVRPEVLQTLLTHEGDREMFRQVYPFSPALVQTLVAVSSVLQRERTALKIMLMLLVARRDTLRVGDLIPCGDLWDMVAHGEEAFSDVMRVHFENAKRLYHGKLRPLLEELNEVSVEYDRPRAGADPELARRLQRFDNDDRLVKTLLLSALVPEVEPLKNLTASRLAALNHGTIKAPVPGAEARVVLGKVRTWASRVGEIRVGEGPDPTITVQVFGVDTAAIIEKARVYDNVGNQIRKIREMLFESLGVKDRDEMFLDHSLFWRGSRRKCDLLYTNVRELPDDSLRAQGDAWKVVIDWPFDDPGHSPSEDHARVERFLDQNDSTRTLVWLPAFFSPRTRAELGKLVILDNLLRGDNLDQYAAHLTLQDRLSARLILENQQSALAGTLRLALNAAYGIAAEPQPGTLDVAHPAEGHFRSLDSTCTPRVPVGADLKGALEDLLSQALEHQFPDHPRFEREVKEGDCGKVLAEIRKAARAEDGRVAVDKTVRPLLKLIANPLGLGHMGEQYFVLEKQWQTHFNRQLAAEKVTTPTVEMLRQWMDRPRAKGLEPHVGNLLILTFAEQTNRALFDKNGQAFPSPALDNLHDGLELRQQELPGDDEWDEARRRAKEVFKLADFDSALLTAANVAALASQVQARAEAARTACHDLALKVRSCLARLGASAEEIAQAPRSRTAHAVDAVVSGLAGKEGTAALRHLALAPLDTSAAAMGRSLESAGVVVVAIDRTEWGAFEAVARIHNERRPEADALLEGLRQALAADEYAVALAPQLADAVKHALRLLTPPAPTTSTPTSTPTPTPPPPPPDGWETIGQGEVTAAPEDWESVAARLAEALKDGDGRRRLVVRWTLQREEPR